MSLIVHPEVNKLKEQLTQLIFEYDNLIGHVCPDLERKYVLEFGLYEYELYKKELEIDKLKRKIQLIRIEINHENKVNINEIERKLNKEFEEYEKQLQAQFDEIKFLEEHEFDELSVQDTKKLKKLYRELVKRLHPDLNPNQNFLEISLFYKAVKCFESGDLKGLESIFALLPENHVEEVSEIENLKNLVKEYEEKISHLKNEYPYNKKELIEDQQSKNDYIDMLVELINDRKEHIKKLEDKIKELI